MLVVYHSRASYVRNIARDLGLSAVYANNMRVRIRRNDVPNVHVNWGLNPNALRRIRQVLPLNGTILNEDISGSLLKMDTFGRLDAAGLPHPRVTRDPRAEGFYERGRYLGRKDGLKGGKGIVIYERGQLPPEGTTHDFYSRVVSKQVEVRIHVWRGTIICEQFKLNPQGSNVLIRNWDNGTRFSTRRLEDRLTPEVANAARDIAIRAVVACGMDFAALDMAYTRGGEWTIFELNSAPGITHRVVEDSEAAPDTYTAYSAAFSALLRRV